MKDFIEKLISRLEELAKLETDREDNIDENGHWNDCEEAFEDGESNGRYQAVMKVKRIVNQLAEEYKGGWIPVSERLPNKEEYLKDDGRFIVTDGNRSYEGSFDIYRGKFQRDCFGSVIEDDKCVIAWMTFLEPYKGE